jgi:hypothetical protein
MMTSHHETGLFLLCVSAMLDLFMGRRPGFVISDFCELLNQNFFIHICICLFLVLLCINDVYLHLYMFDFICFEIFYRDKCQSSISLAEESTNEFNALGMCS